VSPKIQAPRGTYDVLGDDALARTRLEEHARRILEGAGYARIETPVFEATELFARGVGESTDVVQKEMYTIDEGPSESLTLRPEGTAPVCRAYLEHGMHKLPQPVKLWYLSSFFRRERPQAGRFRQFWQIGAEAIGSADPAVDAELILLLSELLETVGARGLRLVISSLGQPESRTEYREELQAYLRAHEDELAREVRDRIDLNPLRAFDAKHAPTQQVMAGAPLLIDRLPADDLEHFEQVKARLDDVGLAYTVDPTMVRGLDYYTRTLFEFRSDTLEAAQNTLGGGGRYDGLVELIGGPPTPGMGWAAGVERILLASPPLAVAPPPLDLYVAYTGPEHAGAAFRLAADARRAGHSARLELGGRSLKGQLKQADRAGARYVAILGDDGTALKDMESGEQKTVETETVMHHIRGGL
jgi:histidyl-tRNA synthetase